MVVVGRKWKHTTFDSLAMKQESELFLVRDSSLQNIWPYLDQDSIMRIGGRLNLSVLPIEQKNQIILPRKYYVSKLIVLHFQLMVIRGSTLQMVS